MDSSEIYLIALEGGKNKQKAALLFFIPIDLKNIFIKEEYHNNNNNNL